MNLIDLIKENQNIRELSRLEIMQLEIFGNSVFQITIALVVALTIFIVGESIDWFLTNKVKKLIEKRDSNFLKAILYCLEKITHFFYACIGIYVGLHILTLHGTFNKVLDSLLVALITVQIILSVGELIKYFIMKFAKVTSSHDPNMTAVNGIMLLVNIALWALGLLTIVANFGVNITSLAASLGIGGIAIAFALQNILEDLFSSFSIYFDKPFAIGDFIVIGDHSGNVTKIGLKTTRLKTLQGEELVVSNKELTTSRIQNFKKLAERRFVFTLGATYETTNDKLEKIPGIIKEICDAEEGIRFDRATFSEFADSSLNYEVVLFFQDGDYTRYMLAREKVNLAIKAAFDKAGIDFAYPTQTLYLGKDSLNLTP